MKNFCVIHILLFILLMLVYQCTKAQDYVITSKGDTLEGDVKPLTYGPEKKVQVTTAGKKNVLSIFQTRAYTYKGDKFEPVKNDKGYVFMKVIKSGYLSLYAFQQENQTTFDGLYLVKKDGSKMEVPNLSFKKMMNRFLEDCPQVKAKIESGELSKRSLEKIVDEYNACVDNRTIDHDKIIAQNKEVSKKISAWDVLEEKVKGKSDFEGKKDALEMITDIRNKVNRGEKVPNFLIEGLKNSLAKAEVTTELDNAINEIKN
jgi:hypothetical protein